MRRSKTMTPNLIKQLLADGEGLTIEYKECVNSLNNSVWKRYVLSQIDTAVILSSAFLMMALPSALIPMPCNI